MTAPSGAASARRLPVVGASLVYALQDRRNVVVDDLPYPRDGGSRKNPP
jgi:hypothetical protein